MLTIKIMGSFQVKISMIWESQGKLNPTEFQEQMILYLSGIYATLQQQVHYVLATSARSSYV